MVYLPGLHPVLDLITLGHIFVIGEVMLETQFSDFYILSLTVLKDYNALEGAVTGKLPLSPKE